MHLKSGPVFFIHVLYVLSYVLSNFLANLVTFTEEILNGKFHFCAVSLPKNKSKSKSKYKIFLTKYRLEACNFVTKEMAKYLSENFQKKKKQQLSYKVHAGRPLWRNLMLVKLQG